MSRIVSWLGARHAPWVVIAVALGLAAPAVTADFTADDHLHRLVSRDDPGIAGLPTRPLDLFVFASGDPADTLRLRDAGMFPWWVDPELKLSFWRPFSSATHALDHALWPDNPAAQLAHNLVWLALGLVVTWLFFRRFLAQRWIAVLALLVYAFDDARGPVVGWIANRNALVALCLAMPVLLAHDRWRRDGWTHGRYLAPAGFAFALGAGESSLAILAYIAAHALWLDRGTWRERALAIAPYLVVVVIWRVIYTQLDYGVFASGIYLDPSGEPLAFMQAAAVRLPFLLAGALALPWSDFASFYPVLGIQGLMLALVLVLLGSIVLGCARLLRRDPTARFFATGMVLAAIPVASTFPADRLLTFIGLGAAGLIAQLLAAALRQRDLLGDTRFKRRSGVALAIGLFIGNVVLAPPLLVLRSRSMVAVGKILDRAESGIPYDATRTVIIVAAPSDALVGFIPLMRHSRRQPCPPHLYWLATLTTRVTVERLDAKTLRITPDDGLMRHEVDQMMRSPRARPFAVGDRVPLTGVTLEVESITADRRPKSVLARFATPLEDPSLTWLRWEGRSYVPYQPPAIGAREVLPAVDFAKLLED